MNMLGSWKLHYTFDMNINDESSNDKPRGASFDDGVGMLCYKLHDRLYKYDTNNNK
jgi:hypothetical protein